MRCCFLFLCALSSIDEWEEKQLLYAITGNTENILIMDLHLVKHLPAVPEGGKMVHQI